MPEHSPLPFVEDIGCRIRDANGISVALCSPDVNGTSASMSKANAAFIVAAANSHADLVKACEETIRHLGRYAEVIASGDCPPLGLYLRDDARQPLMPILRAALAKATGGDDVE